MLKNSKIIISFCSCCCCSNTINLIFIDIFIIFIGFLNYLLLIGNPVLALSLDETSTVVNPPKVITVNIKSTERFFDPLPEIDSDDSYDKNDYGAQGRAIPWKPGEFYIRTGQSISVNQGLKDTFIDLELDYYSLNPGDINTVRTHDYNNPYITDRNIDIGAKLYPGIANPDTYVPSDGIKKIFFTLNYWTEYHYSSSIINWFDDRQRHRNKFQLFFPGQEKKAENTVDQLLFKYYDRYGFIRKQNNRSLENHNIEDLQTYQALYNQIYKDRESFFYFNPSALGRYERKSIKIKFSLPKYYSSYGLKKYVALNNNIGAGYASTNLSQARLFSPRLWVERQSTKEYTWLNLGQKDLWTPARQNKLLIEQYSRYVFNEQNNDIGLFRPEDDDEIIYDPDNQILAYLHIPSTGMYHTHFTVQSCKKLHSSVALDSEGREIKTLDTLTAFDIIHDLGKMAKDPKGVNSEELALDTQIPLKDFYNPHIDTRTSGNTYDDVRRWYVYFHTVPDLNNGRRVDEKSSIWTLVRYFVDLYMSFMKIAEDSAKINNIIPFQMPSNGTLIDFDDSIDTKTLMEKFSESIRENVIEKLDKHPFLATLMDYVMYYNSPMPSRRIKSCSDLKSGIFNSFFMIDTGASIKGSGDRESYRRLYDFLFLSRNYRTLRLRYRNINRDLTGYKHYRHKWWEHTNIDFSCLHLKTVFDDLDIDYIPSEAKKMFFIKPLQKENDEREKLSQITNSKHYTNKLTIEHFFDELTSESFSWENFLANTFAKDYDTGRCEQVNLSNPDADQQDCITNHWSQKWNQYKQFYKDLSLALSQVIELDELQIRLSKSPHHFIDCAPYMISTTKRNIAFVGKPKSDYDQWKNLQSSASLDVVQDFFPQNRSIPENIEKYYVSKHPEAIFGLRDDLQALYTEEGYGNFDYVTFATSLSSLNDNNPKHSPGRPMVIIPGTKFYPPELFQRYPKRQNKSMSIVVQSYPRSSIYFAPERNTDPDDSNQEKIAINLCSITPDSDQAQISDKLQTKIISAINANNDKNRKIEDIISYLNSIKDSLGCIPSREEIEQIVSRDPRNVVIHR